MNQSRTDVKGERLDIEARRIMERNGVTAKYASAEWSRAYGVALKEVMSENTRLAESYNDGARGVEERIYSRLAEHERQMLICQNDTGYVQDKAGEVIGHHAQAIAGSGTGVLGQPGQVNEERLRAATNLLLDRFPSLEQAYVSGVIAPGDWATLATIIPSLAGE